MLENAETRWRRYELAVSEYNKVSSRLNEIYKYFLPRRTNFGDTITTQGSNAGSSFTNKLYDGTAQESIFSYANNLQYSLMPPYQKWHYLKVSARLKELLNNETSKIEQVNKALQQINEKLFSALHSVNFPEATNEAYLDLGCSTGVIFLNVFSEPFSFTAIPPTAIVFEEDAHRTKLENFWHLRAVKGRDLLRIWSEAKITDRLRTQINNEPDKLIELVEGCIYYPAEKQEKKYFYYVQLKSNKTDIYTSWLSFCPYTGFRAYKTSGEIWGRGIADRMLSFAILLNQMSEYGIKAIKFSGYPVIGLVGNTPAFNTKTIRIEPGSVINMPHTGALQKLDLGGNIQEGMLTRKDIADRIERAFFAEPLGNVSDYKDRTATESNIRRTSWLRQNAVSVGRLENEATRPILHKCLIVLREKGIIQDIKIDGQLLNVGEPGKFYDFEFESPLIAMQNEENMGKLDNHISRMRNFYGPSSVAMYDNAKIPGWYGEQANIDLNLLRDEDQLQEVVAQITNALNKNQEELEQAKLKQLAQQPPAHEAGQQERIEGMLGG